jgi:hypothetical protein
MNLLASDVQPTALQLKTIADAQARAGQVTARFKAATAEMPGLNAKLKAGGLPALQLQTP